MVRKIIADSSADLLELEGADFSSVPLTIMAGTNTWVDNTDLSTDEMMDTLASWRGRSTTACPAPDEWLNAFGDADEIFCIAISSALSGSYNSACVAARDYMERYPGRRVHVIDSLLTSSAMQYICEHLRDWINAGDDFDTIVSKVTALRPQTKLLFCLRSVRQLANNGRTSQALAALVGMLNIRLIAKASDKGEVEMLTKARGDKKALAALVEQLKEMGYQGGRIIIHHCRNLAFAEALSEAISSMWTDACVVVGQTRGLCSFYAEDGGLLIGFEV